MPAKPTSPSIAELIRATGVKVTPARLRVLDLLNGAGRPMSHAEIDSAMAALPMDRVTLYRVLDSLVTNALVLKAVDTKGVYHYSAAAAQHRHGSHVHFHCTGCGGSFCLDAPPPKAPRLPRGFRLNAIAFELRGTCSSCIARCPDHSG